MNEEREKLNRVYGRGFHDGMKAAVKQLAKPVQEKVVTETKFNSIYRGVTEQAKKVYQAVPITEHWTIGQVMVELHRTGSAKDQRVVNGCLNSLKEVGLIKEPAPGLWVRTEVRTKPLQVVPAPQQSKEETTVPPINTQPAPQKTDVTALERIGGLSSQVLVIIQSLHQLAADIEATAIEVEEQMEKINRDSATLKQLQQLLKGLQQ